MAERIYCSEVAREGGAEVAGTAVEVDLWLLLEHPRPWKPKAIEDNDLGDEANAAFRKLEADARADGAKLRIQFIKQAASADAERPRLFFADARDPSSRFFTGAFEHARDVAQLRYDALLRGDVPGRSDETPAPIYLVCTNGQRDLCCARFGLPLYETLRQRFGGRIWQTTHVGGHRYAPNLVCLPSGVTYGFVEPDVGEAVVAAHDAGEIDYARLRGRSCLAPAAQAAEAFLGRALGQRRYILEAESADPTGMTFRFEGGRITVAAIDETEPVLASCGKAPKAGRRFEEVSIDLD